MSGFRFLGLGLFVKSPDLRVDALRKNRSQDCLTEPASARVQVEGI